MNITTDNVFGVFFAGSAVTAGMVLVAEAATACAARCRAARRPTVVVRTTATAAPAAAVEPERADV
ncbi:hypothetical protein [Kitasatospora griseola]|uniref:hypothetical protein n=1 Tax=Kitasatospora griseola TaxID=2064 RepID=UPI003821B6DD